MPGATKILFQFILNSQTCVGGVQSNSSLRLFFYLGTTQSDLLMTYDNHLIVRMHF